MPQPEPQVMNFQFAPSPWGSMFDSYGKMKEAQNQQIQNEMNRMKMPYIAPQQQAVLQNQQLQNQDLQAQAKYWDQNYANDAQIKQVDAAMAEQMKRAEINHMKMQDASTQNELTNPLLGSAGPQGLLAAYNYAVQNNDPNADLLLQELKRTAGGKQDNSLLFRSYPMDVKRGLIAQGTGLGYDQATAAQMLSQGWTIPEMASQRGIPSEDISNYESVYNATQPNITAAKNREAASAELDYLQPIVNEWVGDYVSPVKIAEYSPKQIIDMATGMNKDRQAKFIAGSMVIPEIIYMRLRLAQGESSHVAFKEMEERMAGRMKIFETGMTPDLYKESNLLANDILSNAAKEANRVIYSPAQSNSKMVNSVSKDMERENLEADAISRGFKQVNGKWVKQ